MLQILLYNFNIAVEAIQQNKLRSLLTSLGIIFGVASVIAMLAEAARANDWCSHYASVLEDRNWFYQQCEDNASYLVFHSASGFPSLMQGPAYYRMIRDTTKYSFEGAIDWEDGLNYRMERRERWIQLERSALLILGEGALTLDLGPEKAEIMADLRKTS
jgi:ABC-type antimicrobial peptide transport system permease subunit